MPIALPSLVGVYLALFPSRSALIDLIIGSLQMTQDAILPSLPEGAIPKILRDGMRTYQRPSEVSIRITSSHLGACRRLCAVNLICANLLHSSSGGFYCVDCPKLFPLLPPAPPPMVSPAPGSSGSRRRSNRRQFLTRAKVLRDRLEARKKTRNSKRNVGGGGGIRGRWAPTGKNLYAYHFFQRDAETPSSYSQAGGFQ